MSINVPRANMGCGTSAAAMAGAVACLVIGPVYSIALEIASDTSNVPPARHLTHDEAGTLSFVDVLGAESAAEHVIELHSAAAASQDLIEWIWSGVRCATALPAPRHRELRT